MQQSLAPGLLKLQLTSRAPQSRTKPINPKCATRTGQCCPLRWSKPWALLFLTGSYIQPYTLRTYVTSLSCQESLCIYIYNIFIYIYIIHMYSFWAQTTKLGTWDCRMVLRHRGPDLLAVKSKALPRRCSALWEHLSGTRPGIYMPPQMPSPAQSHWTKTIR